MFWGENPYTNHLAWPPRPHPNIPLDFYLGCRKWGCNKWGLKGCLAALPGNRPKSAFSPFFCLFLPFPEGAKSTWEIQKTEEKGLFPQISSDLLKPPSLKPPFAAPQFILNLFMAHFRLWNSFCMDLRPSRSRQRRERAPNLPEFLIPRIGVLEGGCLGRGWFVFVLRTTRQKLKTAPFLAL